MSIGVAAHITAASLGGPRYNPALTSQERSSIENAIWLCQSCGALVDRDEHRFTVDILRDWRNRAESAASLQLGAGTKYRAIAASEVRQELAIGELAVIRALAEEFGCHVETNISVAAGDGWLNLDAAVVRGDDLVAIDIHQYTGDGLRYFQIEHFVELGSKLKLDRFHSLVLFIAVVSNASPELDEAVKNRLERIKNAAPIQVQLRFYRLNNLRAKYGL